MKMNVRLAKIVKEIKKSKGKLETIADSNQLNADNGSKLDVAIIHLIEAMEEVDDVLDELGHEFT